MKIQSTRQAAQTVLTAKTTGPDSVSDKAGNTIKDVVTKGAFTAGGALGGTGLGVATGMALSNVTGNPVFGQFGGVVGAIGGAATGLVASQHGVSKANLARSVGSWVGASVLSSGGMWAVGGAAGHLASHGASAVLGANGALLGAVAGGLVGAALPFIGSKGRISGGLKDVAATAAGGTAGVLAGAAVQAGIANFAQAAFPQLSMMLAPLPLLIGVAGGTLGVDLSNNSNYYEPPKPGAKKANDLAWAAVGGYAGGALLGAAAHLGLGGSMAYTVIAPVVGAASAGLAGLASYAPDNSGYAKASKTIFLSGLGAGIGDAVGAGLTALTGNDMYRNIGAAAGAVNGLTAGLRWSGIDDKKGLPVVTGLLSGGASGVLLGAGISALSGQDIWNTVVPVLGAATGALTGLALSMKDEEQ